MKIQLSSSDSRNGSVLVMTLVTGLVIGIALAGYLSLIGNQHKASMRDQAWQNAVPVAEAGIEEALSHLQQNGPFESNLLAQGWALLNGQYRKRGNLPDNSYYLVAISTNLDPIITSQGFVRLPMVTNYLCRTLLVTAKHHYLIGKGLIVKTSVNANGNAVLADAYDSADSGASTFGHYDPLKAQDGGGIATMSSLPNQLMFGSAKIYGPVATGPGGSISTRNWTVGSHAWQTTHSSGIQPGWLTANMSLNLPDVVAPFTSGYLTPTGGVAGAISYSYILNSGNYQIDSGTVRGKVLVNGNAVLYVTAGALINFDPLADSISIAPNASLQLYVACDTANLPNVVNDQTPINFAYYGLPTNKNVTQKVNADFIGTVYAPNAKYTLGGNGIGAPNASVAPLSPIPSIIMTRFISITITISLAWPSRAPMP